MNPNINPQGVKNPFRHFCMSVGAIPTSYKETLSYYETLLYLIRFLEDRVIPAVDNNAEALEELQGLFVQLKDYVTNYFENLDVQEEINNKLDEMAESGELADLIEQFLGEEVEYIFPKFYSDEYSQDFCLIKYGDKNILIDTGIVSNWSNVKSFLDDNSVSSIDLFILSHYDPDHVENITNLVNYNYINNNTVVYLPVVPDRFSSVKVTENNVKTMLTNNNINYSTPTEKYIYEFSDTFSIQFGNLNKAYMEENYTNYNYTSMVCLVKHKNVYSFYAGDAGIATYTYLQSIDFINRTIELYKQGHHGIDLPVNVSFIKEISPRYTVQLGGIKDFERGIYQCGETTQLIALGTLYYPSYINKDYIKFVSNGTNILNKQGIISSYSNRMGNITLYVDSSALSSDIQDGSEQRPFKELTQAFGYINGLAPSHVTINVADGTYGTETSETDEVTFINQHEIIVIGHNGNASSVIIDNLLIFNANITFNWVTLHSSKNAEALRTNNSNVSLVNCIVDHDSSVNYGIVATKGSSLYLNNCTIKNCTAASISYNNSSIIFDGITLVNVTRLRSMNNGTDQFYKVDFTNNEPNECICNYPLANFSKIYITVAVKGNHNKQTTVIISQPPYEGGTYNPDFHTINTWYGSNKINIDSFDIRLRTSTLAGNKIYIDVQKRVIINTTNNSITTVDITGNEMYEVIAVLGLLNI